MILLGDFFKIVSLETEEGSINALLEINVGHRIFEGHFPNQPVVPGVCMMQMVKEIVEQALDKKTDISAAAEMKFLAVIDPTKNNIINATIKYTMEEDGKVKVVATLFKDELMHFKLKAQLQKVL
jgi:3-hydroxyacyl-[acyl-carrier-protein] dehydratase